MVLLIPYAAPTEAVRLTESDVNTDIDGNPIGTGSLFVTENFVLWLNTNNEGIQLEYKQITLHAISRDLQAFPREHLLLHYEGKLPGLNEESQSTEESDNEEIQDTNSDTTLTEIRFIPDKKESLENLFEAIADCQTLHPDDECQLSDDEFEFDDADDGGGDTYFTNEEGLAHLTEEGRANLDRFNQMLQAGQGDADLTSRTNQMTITNGHHEEQENQDGQFQDADMED